MLQTEAYVMLSMVLFVLGAMGVMLRRNAILVFMSVELMLNAANLALVAFARQWGNTDGHLFRVLRHYGGRGRSSGGAGVDRRHLPHATQYQHRRT